MTTTATNNSTAIVCVPRAKATSSFRNRMMIAILVILCGAALQKSARSMFNLPAQPSVPEPKFSSLFDLEGQQVNLPVLETTVWVPYMPLLHPKPVREPTPTEKVVAYISSFVEATIKKVKSYTPFAKPQPEPPTKTEIINAFFKKTLQQVSSCRSSLIACAIRMKDSVVKATTTAGDKNVKNNNYFINEKIDTMTTSSYKACAIRIKDSVVKNCLGFVSKFGIDSSETSAGDNNNNNDDGNGHKEGEEGEYTNWWESTMFTLPYLLACMLVRPVMYSVFEAVFPDPEEKREVMEGGRKHLRLTAMVLWFLVIPALVLVGLALICWYGCDNDLAWAVNCHIGFQAYRIYKYAGMLWRRYKYVQIEEVIFEVLSWETKCAQAYLRHDEICSAYLEKHGFEITDQGYEDMLNSWYDSYMLHACGGHTPSHIKDVAFSTYQDNIVVDNIEGQETNYFDQYLSEKIQELYYP